MGFRINIKRQALAMILVVSLLHQLGACPCGCLEHNYWLQALGVTEDHDEVALKTFDDLSLDGETHDCECRRSGLYLDNSVTHELASGGALRDLAATQPVPVVMQQVSKVRLQDRGPPGCQIGRSACAVLQVFLI